MCGGACLSIRQTTTPVVSIKEEKDSFQVKLDFSPKNFWGVVDFFVLEGEKISIVVSLTNALFHLTAAVLQRTLSDSLFSSCLYYHEVGHEVGHLTHPLHFISDLSFLIQNIKADGLPAIETIFKGREQQIDTSIKVLRFVANFFSTVAVVAQFSFLLPTPFAGLMLVANWSSLFSYSLTLVSLMQSACPHHDKNHEHDHNLKEKKLLNISGMFSVLEPIAAGFGVSDPVLRIAGTISDIAIVVFDVLVIKQLLFREKEIVYVPKTDIKMGGEV